MFSLRLFIVAIEPQSGGRVTVVLDNRNVSKTCMFQANGLAASTGANFK